MQNISIVQVKEYKDALMKKAEELAIHGIPENIGVLNDLLDKPMFKERNLTEIHQDLNIPIPQSILVSNQAERSDGGDADELAPNQVRGDVMYLTSGSVPCNEPLCEMIEIVKPIVRKLVEDTNVLKMWVSLMIPKIEDGNNFGVSMLKGILAGIQAVESAAVGYFNQISRYFLSRAKMISKVAKYPQIDDFRRAVVELDERQYLSLWSVVCNVRNGYSAIHDIIIKNMEKLKKPRSSNADNLY